MGSVLSCWDVSAADLYMGASLCMLLTSWSQRRWGTQGNSVCHLSGWLLCSMEMDCNRALGAMETVGDVFGVLIMGRSRRAIGAMSFSTPVSRLHFKV